MDQLKERFEAWLSMVSSNAYLQALVIIVVAVVLAKIADWLICGLVGAWAKRTKSQVDDELIGMLHRPVFLSVVLAGLLYAADRLDLGTKPKAFADGSIKTIAIAVWLGFALRFTRLVLGFLSHHQDRFHLVQARTLPLFNNLAMLVLVGGAIYFFFLAWKIDVTAWLASAGIIGIALSFAAKDSLANLFAGVFILADAPYKVGDFVILDTGERGRVTQIGIRSTRMLTRDDVEITIPNAVMGNSKITNESGGPHIMERIRVKVSVAYGSDIDRVREILVGVAVEHPEIAEDPEPRVRFRSFGNSGLDFELLCWISEPMLRGQMLDALNCDVYKRFSDEGIEIPYPKQDVYVREMPPSGAS